MDIGKINGILMRTAAVLLALVLLSSSVVTGRYARYVTTATYEDGARVARFNIVEDGRFVTDMGGYVAPGITKDVVLIKNYSEVAVEFTITVKNVYQNLPLTFEIWDGDTKLPQTEGSDGTVSFTGTVGASQQERVLQLGTVWAPGDANLKYCGRVDLIQLTVDAVQID